MIIASITFAISMTIGLAYGTITRNTSSVEGINYRVFVYGNNPSSILSDTNADFEVTGFPSTQIFIRNWDELTILEKTTIESQLREMGYVDARDTIN